MKQCVIFAGGPEEKLPCRPFPENAYVLCADSGLLLAQKMNVKPDLVLGDFDSLGKIPSALPCYTAPIEKDDTDTMLAIRTALEKGYTDITIFGAFGGRLDHTFANFQALEFIRRHNATGQLVGASDYAKMLMPHEQLMFPKQDGWSLSLFSWSESCTGVNIQGVHYPMENGTLYRSFPLGVSNEIIEESANISIESGVLLAICSRL